jgi:hypothetical protein
VSAIGQLTSEKRTRAVWESLERYAAGSINYTSSFFGELTRFDTGYACISRDGNGRSIAWGIAVSAAASQAS